jgi:ATPase complex subunit ATP10
MIVSVRCCAIASSRSSSSYPSSSFGREIIPRSRPRYYDAVEVSKRTLFGPPSTWEAEYEELIARRNKSIIMHPNGYGQHILPGNYVTKIHPKTGAVKRVMLEFEYGHFWALKELSLTNNKPIVSNDVVIPANQAEVFPTITGLINLHEEIVDIPQFFTRYNRTADELAHCTLVAISSKEFGAQLLPSWIDPFDKALIHPRHDDVVSSSDDNGSSGSDNNSNNNYNSNSNSNDSRYEVVRITINEGRIAKLLSRFITSGTKKNTPPSDHHTTLLYYGDDTDNIRDILRMHNIYTSYVFLLDGIGRIRWAGSGAGSESEVQNMISIARNLVHQKKTSSSSTTLSHRTKSTTAISTPRVGKKLPRD